MDREPFHALDPETSLVYVSKNWAEKILNEINFCQNYSYRLDYANVSEYIVYGDILPTSPVELIMYSFFI